MARLVRRGRRARAVVLCSGLLLVIARQASAQEDQPSRIGPFAVDVHGAMPSYGSKPQIAQPLGLSTTDLPSRGWGFDVGAHWYPVRVGWVTLGVGGDLHRSVGHATSTSAAAAGTGEKVTTHFMAVSPQLSLNFGGRRRGWSYISGGYGYSTFSVGTTSIPAPSSSPKLRTINFGAGARWFSGKHLAFSVDLRFYSIKPQASSTDPFALPKMTLSALSAGISLR
jgi:hypothetical protein